MSQINTPKRHTKPIQDHDVKKRINQGVPTAIQMKRETAKTKRVHRKYKKVFKVNQLDSDRL